MSVGIVRSRLRPRRVLLAIYRKYVSDYVKCLLFFSTLPKSAIHRYVSKPRKFKEQHKSPLEREESLHSNGLAGGLMVAFRCCFVKGNKQLLET
jgi:hypothetical protein